MTSENELLGCPFCGGDVKISETYGGDFYIGHVCGESPNCVRLYFNDRYQDGTPESFEEQKEAAVIHWNTRASRPDVNEQMLEALKEIEFPASPMSACTDTTAIMKQHDEPVDAQERGSWIKGIR
jgi:hypothetical protein